MNPTNSAQITGSGTKSSSSQSGTGATPFDEIVTLEQKEAERVKKELAAMEDERSALKEKLKKEGEESQRTMRDAAKEELKKFSNEELASLIKKAESEGIAEGKNLDAKYASSSKQVVSTLKEKFLDGSFLSIAA